MSSFTIERKKLYDEIWDISARKVADKYGISYSRLLSKCRECNIPLPPSGYFTKLQFGKPVTQTNLPGSDIQYVIIESPDSSKSLKEPISIAISDIVENPVPVDQNHLEPSTLTSNSDDASRVPLDRYVDPQEALRQELFKKVWEHPMSDVSKEYGISNVALRKRCVKLGVPVPERGYWAKLKAGKPVNKPASLPTLQMPSQAKPKTGDQHELHIKPDALSFMQEEGRKEILSLASRLEVGGPHTKMLDTIQELENSCREWHKKDTYRYSRNYRADAPFLANTMNLKSFARAFHIIDALVKALRPYKGEFTSDHRIVVNGEPVAFSMEEGKDKIPHIITPEEQLQLVEYEERRKVYSYEYKPPIPKHDHPWNGRLRISVNGKYSFADCKSYVLEDRTGEILIAFFEASNDERIKRLEREERQRKEHEEHLRREAIREAYNLEVKRTQALVNESADYAVACQIRSYIAGIEQQPDHPNNNPQGLEWAKAKADWYDPTISREDTNFGKRQHSTEPSRKEPTEKRWW